MTDEKELLKKFSEEVQHVIANDKVREGYIIRSGSLKAICISPLRNYGGGSRALWAIEGVEAQLESMARTRGHTSGSNSETKV